MSWFVLGTLAVLALLLSASTVVGWYAARAQTLTECSASADALAEGLVAPLVNDRLREGDQKQRDRLASALESKLDAGDVVRFKIWDPNGTILWSDDAEQVGRTVSNPKLSQVLGGRDVAAEISSLDRAENAADSDLEGPVVEVYAQAVGIDGQPFVLEMYVPDSFVQQRHMTLVQLIALPSSAGLILFALASGALAYRLSRRVEHGQARQDRLSRQAVYAADIERRRLAQTLHDEVIPDIASVGYALTELAKPGSAASTTQRESLVGQLRGLVERDLDILRLTLTDLYPPNIDDGGLRAAVEVQAASARAQGLTVEIDWADNLDLRGAAARLCYRIIREGLRNVVAHAGATTVWIRLVQDGAGAELAVSDDGNGIDRAQPPQPGHFGLTLLRDTIEELGGAITLVPRSPCGATLQATFPVNLAHRLG